MIPIVEKRPMIYIASPYTKGDQALNVRFQCEVFSRLIQKGFVPVAPLWSHYQQIFRPLPYEVWLSYDYQIIRRCDALLRLNASVILIGSVIDDVVYAQAESTGADREVEFAKSINLPVFFDIPTLCVWQHGRR